MSGAPDFWSRRRALVAQEQGAEEDRLVAQQRLEQERQDDELSDQELFEKYELPKLEQVTSSEELRQFLRDGVPQRLKTMALRKMWRMNPILANVDGLVDYGEDYANPQVIGDAVKTAYQVGKGMLKHIEALEREAEQAAQSDGEVVDDSSVSSDAPEDDGSGLAAIQVSRSTDAVDDAPDGEADAEVQPVPRPRRRMAFTTDDRGRDAGSQKETA